MDLEKSAGLRVPKTRCKLSKQCYARDKHFWSYVEAPTPFAAFHE
jgi:hypothetical protein